MAWPIGRLWRVCMVGVGVGCAYVWRMHGVGVWCAMACVGTVCRRWVYGVQALGVRMVSVCVCVGCMCMVYVWLACVCRYIDVVSV